MRLARATLARLTGAAIDPDAVRPAGAALPRRAPVPGGEHVRPVVLARHRLADLSAALAGARPGAAHGRAGGALRRGAGGGPRRRDTATAPGAASCRRHAGQRCAAWGPAAAA